MAASNAKRRSSQVPGQFLGYSLQTTRAVMRLLQADAGSFVSVEVLDDVAVTRGEGGTTLEQTKSAGSSNPIADRSVELWKTLASWVHAVENAEVDVTRTSFEMFVSKRRRGQIAEALAGAKNPLEAIAALQAAKTSLWGKGPQFAKRSKVASTIVPYVDRVFQAKLGLVAAIIERFSLVFGARSSQSDLIELLKHKIISDEMLDVVANQMLGWAKTEIDSRLERGEAAILSTDAFNSELGAFVRRVDRFAILNSFAPTPDKAVVDLELQSRMYVRQLDIIGADYDAKLRAANDYLRASVNRSTWASKGLVHRSSFDEFEDALIRTWSAKKDIVAIQSKGHPADTCGRLLYSECALVQSPLEGRSVPPHFTPGCYHALADQLAVGWHPDFKNVLDALSAKKGSGA
jgi:ABC-3C protein